MALGRADTTQLLRVAAESYLLRLGYACHVELGLVSWGRLRADILAVKLNADVAIIEIKSSVPDFCTDGKWKKYLEFCNRMWFVFSQDTYERLNKLGHLEEVRSNGVGILVLWADGYLKSKHPTTRRHMPGKNKKEIVVRMAWRAGDVSKRNSRRVRIFLDEESKAQYVEAQKLRKARPTRRRRRGRNKYRAKSPV